MPGSEELKLVFTTIESHTSHVTLYKIEDSIEAFHKEEEVCSYKEHESNHSLPTYSATLLKKYTILYEATMFNDSKSGTLNLNT
jgi:hypothetical protein